MQDFNVLKKGGVSLFVSQLLGTIASLLSLMIISRKLNLEAYGSFRQLFTIYSFVGVLLTSGLQSYVSFSLPKKTKSENKFFLKKIYFILYLLAFIIATLFFFNVDKISLIYLNPLIKNSSLYFSILILFLVPSTIINNVLIYIRKYKSLVISNLLSKLIILVGVFLFSFNETNFNYVLLLYIISSGFFLIVFHFIIHKYYDKVDEKKIELDYKKLLLFILPITVSSVSILIVNLIFEIHISRKFGTETFAIFSNGFYKIPFLGIIVSSLSIVLLQEFSKKKSTINEKKIIWKKVLKTTIPIQIGLVSFLLIFSKQIVLFLFGLKYLDAVPIFIVNVISISIDFIQFNSLFFSVNKRRLYLHVHLIIMLLSFIFILLDSFINFSLIQFSIVYGFLTLLKIIIFYVLSSRILNSNFIEIINLKDLLLHLFISLPSSVLAFSLSFYLLGLIGFHSPLSVIVYGSIIYFILIVISDKLFKSNFLYFLNHIKFNRN